jgi:hypothetical protein
MHMLFDDLLKFVISLSQLSNWELMWLRRSTRRMRP